MLHCRNAFIIAVCLLLAACVISPLSRTPSESSLPVTLNGFIGSSNHAVTIQAIDQNTGTLASLGTAKSSASGMSYTTSGGINYTLYPWTYNAGVLAPNYWSPQNIVPDLATSQGHLEIFASTGSFNFPTFSQGAANAAMQAGQNLEASGAQYADGNSTVLFDQTGVGYGAGTSWVSLAGMTMNPPTSGYSPVAWSVGSYTVENGNKTIYALICAPTKSGSYPVVIYNHPGLPGDGGNINGKIASGWTTPPAGGVPDTLGQCVDWAKRGWVFAATSFRGQYVNIQWPGQSQPTSWPSGGSYEFCMGEVTDVLALANLLANHTSASAITVGGPGQTVSLNTNGKMFMYGYSHGGCVTYRAVEQGAPVNAFSVIEGFTDLRQIYLDWLSHGATTPTAAVNSGAFQPPFQPPATLANTYPPDAAHVMGYNWRSAHYFASRGDLAIQQFKTMPILILHGDDDAGNPAPLDQAALISADIGATNIFVGPNSVSAPVSEPCIAGAAGAPVANPAVPLTTCPISFVPMDSGDSCFNNSAPPNSPGLCQTLLLPLTPSAGQPQQQHYLVVYHNMDHFNGGQAIENTFDHFVQNTFGRQAGCDGLAADNCNSD